MLHPFLEDRRRERAAVLALIAAVKSGSPVSLRDALAEVRFTWTWEAAFRACSRLEAAPSEIQTAFLDLWIEAGETLRSSINDDLVTLAALRVLLPPYDGPPVRLFRGESSGNRRRRTYGMSWSSNRDIAAQFARSRADLYERGTVLIETVAPTQAIVSAPALLLPATETALEEFIVDRRHLDAVYVLERFQGPPST